VIARDLLIGRQNLTTDEHGWHGSEKQVWQALIAFRKLVVYLSLLRSVRANWKQAFGTA